MKRFEIKADRLLVVSGGEIQYGQTIATIETDLSPAQIANMITYGQAKAVAVEKVACLAEAPVQVVPPSTVVTDAIATQEPSPPPEIVKPEPASEIEGLKVKPDTIMALKDLGITTISELRTQLVSGQPMKGIGDFRRKELNAALEKI